MTTAAPTRARLWAEHVLNIASRTTAQRKHQEAAQAKRRQCDQLDHFPTSALWVVRQHEEKEVLTTVEM